MQKEIRIGSILLIAIASFAAAASATITNYDYSTTAGLTEVDPCGGITVGPALTFSTLGGPDCHVSSQETYTGGFKMEWDLTPTSFYLGPLCDGYWATGVWNTGGQPYVSNNYFIPASQNQEHIFVGYSNCYTFFLYLNILNNSLWSGDGTAYSPGLTLGHTYHVVLKRVVNSVCYTVYDGSNVFFQSPAFPVSPGAAFDTTIHFGNSQYGGPGFWANSYNYLAASIDNLNIDNAYTGSGCGVTPTVPATVDIDPNTLNTKSKGQFITAYIELPSGYNVNNIDVSTVKLNGVVPAQASPTAVGDHDNDGVPDLMVKFNRAAVIGLVSPPSATLTVSGSLTGGTPFTGSDTIRVL